MMGFFSKIQPLNSDFSAVWIWEFERDKRIAEVKLGDCEEKNNNDDWQVS